MSDLSEYLESYCKRLVTDLHLKATRGVDRIALDELLSQSWLPEILAASAKMFAQRIYDRVKPVEFDQSDRYDIRNLTHVKAHIDLLRDRLIGAILLHDDEVRQLCDFTVRLQLDMLIRPRQTLVGLLFKTRDEKTTDDCICVAQGFGCDRPFIQRLVHALQTWQSDYINQHQFEDIAGRTEQRVYKETPVSGLLTDINLFLDFESLIMKQTDRKVRTEILLLLFRKRNLTELYDEFVKITSEKKLWTPDEIENELERFLLVGPFEGLEDDGRGQRSSRIEQFSTHGVAERDWSSFNGFEQHD